MALVLGAILALVLSASASAASPFPKIKRGHELACSGARAELAVTVSWQKATSKGKHVGLVAALIRGKNGFIHSRPDPGAGKRLRRVRSQSTEHRFRFPKHASRRLCERNAKAEVVASQGHNKDCVTTVHCLPGRNPELRNYRLTRKTLGGKASATGEAGAAGRFSPGSGRHCKGGGGGHAIIKLRAQLSQCDLSGAELTNATLAGADLIRADLIRADLSDANLAQANLSDADLRDDDLRGAVLFFADLSGANLYRADLRRADLRGADLRYADLSGANLTDADLTGADLIRADLSRADLTDANLRRADLSDADLRDADLRGADLFFADLSDANLDRADLSDADLRGADLSGANLTDADLSGAICHDTTDWPDGTRNHGTTCPPAN